MKNKTVVQLPFAAQVVCDKFDATPADLRDPKQDSALTEAKSLLVGLLVANEHMPIYQMTSMFGYKDFETMNDLLNNHNDEYDYNEGYKELYLSLKKTIYGGK